jgi:hypothetical protein
MASNNSDYVTFKLMGSKKPINYQIGLKGMMLPDDKGVNRRVQYVPGSDSIFVKDHKGDEKPKRIWLENGILKVSKHDKPLLQLIYKHKKYNVEFEKVDPDKKAELELAKMEIQEKAIARVNTSDPNELMATAIVLMGHASLTLSTAVVKMKVKKMAFEQPEKLLSELNSTDYRGKYIAALSVLREAVMVNESQTAVTWPDGNVIVHVAAGQDPITKLGSFLSGDSETALTTLQTLGEQIKQSYTRKVELNADEEIEVLVNSKNDKNKVDLHKAPFSDLLDKDTDTTLDSNNEVSNLTLDEAKDMYKVLLDKNVPPNMKNNLDWIKSKIQEVDNA